MASALQTLLAAVLAGLALVSMGAAAVAQQVAPCSQPHHKVDFVSGEPCPKPSAFEVEMYEANGTLVIKTAGPAGDMVVDGTRVVSALRALGAKVDECAAETIKLRLDHARLVEQNTAQVNKTNTQVRCSASQAGAARRRVYCVAATAPSPPAPPWVPPQCILSRLSKPHALP